MDTLIRVPAFMLGAPSGDTVVAPPSGDTQISTFQPAPTPPPQSTPKEAESTCSSSMRWLTSIFQRKPATITNTPA